MNFKKIIITIVSICILIYLASHIRYEYLDYTSHVLTKEQEDILYSSTLDLTQENLLESGFQLGYNNPETLEFKYDKYYKTDDLSASCDITFKTQESMTKYDSKDVEIDKFDYIFKMGEWLKTRIGYHKVLIINTDEFEIYVNVDNFQKTNNDVWDIISPLLTNEE